MRSLLALLLFFLPCVQAQNSAVLKAVEPDYNKYSEDLATNFDIANASVTLTVAANGKPLGLDKSSVPLPMAVVMALKDYEFRPQAGGVSHVPGPIEGSYQIKIDVPIRRSKEPLPTTTFGASVAKALIVKHLPPTYPEYLRDNRIQGTSVFEAVITKQGEVASLRISSGPFVLIESAYKAVKQWQYRPFLVNHEPVEVLTEIEVGFNRN